MIKQNIQWTEKSFTTAIKFEIIHRMAKLIADNVHLSKFGCCNKCSSNCKFSFVDVTFPILRRVHLSHCSTDYLYFALFFCMMLISR